MSSIFYNDAIKWLKEDFERAYDDFTVKLADNAFVDVNENALGISAEGDDDWDAAFIGIDKDELAALLDQADDCLRAARDAYQDYVWEVNRALHVFRRTIGKISNPQPQKKEPAS